VTCKLHRLILVALLALCVPFQAALAVSTAQCMDLHGHHDGGHAHDGQPGSDSHHGKDTASHCGPCSACCTSTAIAHRAGFPLAPAARHAVAVAAGPAPSAEPAGALDRPPRAL
jgi:hypothetical protein